jgi:LmbE family N-acetylglucosaminyl deacetylase
LGCGGLIARARRAGVPVGVVFLTDGSRSHDDRPVEHRPVDLVGLRQEEAHRALARLGVPPGDIRFLGYPDGGLRDLPDDRREALYHDLVALLRERRPEIVLLPHGRDAHPDHEATYVPLIDALCASGQSCAVYAYQVWLLWSRTRLFDNLKLSDLRGVRRVAVAAADLEAKRAAMAEYASQLEALPPKFVARALGPFELFFPVEPGAMGDEKAARRP